MHARQRNFGNGYGSGSFGMEMSGSMRGHQHRGYGRGWGRSRSYQNNLPPPWVQHRSGGDVFMEAGRLATEYLVSQGVLPQTVFSSLQNSNFRTQAGEFQRSPAADKRRYTDCYSSASSWNNLKGRRSHHNDSHFGRSGSWSEGSKGFEVETGEVMPIAEDITSSVLLSRVGDSDSMLDKYNLHTCSESKTCSLSVGKEIVHDCEIAKVSEEEEQTENRCETLRPIVWKG